MHHFKKVVATSLLYFPFIWLSCTPKQEPQLVDFTYQSCNAIEASPNDLGLIEKVQLEDTLLLSIGMCDNCGNTRYQGEMELLDNQLSLEVIPIYDTLWGVDDNGDSLYMLNEFVTECGCYKLFNFKINQSSLADVETITLNGMRHSK
ncbi:hypothetical protein [Chondrinema litorale]|uniref:hypothetical protein n=1 Tax=Chondrinema litorale TaxID=2994555 RepID=UPI002542FF2A|nr:hypothetical protein [Chondrinema litorale]UZR94589.1 hypothetical protein OQ292_01990 [Chondrinema litorale]